MDSIDQFESAVEQHQKAIEFASQSQLASCQIESHCKVGQLKELMNFHHEALNHFQEGLVVWICVHVLSFIHTDHMVRYNTQQC